MENMCVYINYVCTDGITVMHMVVCLCMRVYRASISDMIRWFASETDYLVQEISIQELRQAGTLDDKTADLSRLRL